MLLLDSLLSKVGNSDPGISLNVHNNTGTGSTTRDELIQLSECICPGYTLTYQCNLVGRGGATLWNGSLFDCPSKSNQILLRHSEFEDSASGDCNSEAVIANSIGISLTNSSNQCYSSQLNIAVSPSMNNKTIECNHEDIQQGRVTSIGVRMLNFTSGNFFFFFFFFLASSLPCSQLNVAQQTERCATLKSWEWGDGSGDNATLFGIAILPT